MNELHVRLNILRLTNPNTYNVGKCNATDAHTCIHFEEGSTSFIRHGVNDKLKYITLAEISSSYVRDTCDSEVKSTNPNCQTTFPYNIVNVDTTYGPINTASKTKLKAYNNRTSLSRSPKCNNISRRSSSVPVNTSKVKLDGNLRKKRFKSLRLINPIFGVRRCNLRILSKPPMVTGSVSHEVDNTILVGNQIGFNMNGKECDVQHILANGIQETMTGGILAVWDTSCFSLIESLEGNDFFALLGNCSLFKQLSQDDIQFLDCSFITLEIKEAIWDCSSAKSPGLDGFTFKFFKKHWDIVEHDVVSYVKDFEVSAHIPKGCNSSFITLVPKIRSCLDSAYASVLVNGSPTKEFKMERGLRQGDPLSPFLFILAIEALNVDILEATNRDLFHRVKVRKDKFHISHLHFADDALIMGEWSLMNALNLSRILTCFHLASGLKVNFSKSKLFRIGVSNVELYSIASSIGCLASHLPCIYHGIPIGANMSRCINWKPLVDKFQKRLSKWKWKSFSIGGRVTLIKSVLNSLGVYYFSNFKALKKIITKLESIRRKFFWGGNNDENKIAWVA
ncbi:putative RNA-directed DNA polymerase, eukaryota, reverse transcriptase zinc-binding domain protein [Tanacetum coccineum]